MQSVGSILILRVVDALDCLFLSVFYCGCLENGLSGTRHTVCPEYDILLEANTKITRDHELMINSSCRQDADVLEHVGRVLENSVLWHDLVR